MGSIQKINLFYLLQRLQLISIFLLYKVFYCYSKIFLKNIETIFNLVLSTV